MSKKTYEDGLQDGKRPAYLIVEDLFDKYMAMSSNRGDEGDQEGMRQEIHAANYIAQAMLLIDARFPDDPKKAQELIAAFAAEYRHGPGWQAPLV